MNADPIEAASGIERIEKLEAVARAAAARG
jgi:hypothetical protein